eukprot:CAMPEP_0118644630 /NCGR_PEP_ID=MMETSP0785-20121206/7051_1 /TAXON_ID=91992 /ORGANISM="Bolidomonas pacifica, Strain CCMP 1866" /LENGTH=242 /DNA_ID=CAMNT_0006536421 /DNA_START=116 /DNA_END=840 /DNA_ORIENTATION=+
MSYPAYILPSILLLLLNLPCVIPLCPPLRPQLPPLNNPNLVWQGQETSTLSIHNLETKTTTSASFPTLSTIISKKPSPRPLLQACLPSYLTDHTILDLTFGFGSDSLLLLEANTNDRTVKVHGTERDPRVYALVSSALLSQPTLKDVLTVSNLDVLTSPTLLPPSLSPTCVYIDVMFPPSKSKRSKAKGPMELLRTLHETKVQTEEEKEEVDKEGKMLIEFGLSRATERVVCKRPKSATPCG